MTVPLAAPDVMCLVKRHTYELAFAMPHSPQGSPAEALPYLHVRVKHTRDAGGFVLNLGDVECFYDDLLQVMEYIQNERQRSGLSKSIG